MEKISQLFRIILLGIVLISTTFTNAEDWPQWRGPNRDGKSGDINLLKKWSSNGPTLVWKTTGLGKGFSSVSVIGNRLYCMGDLGDGSYLLALSANDGKILWSTKVGRAGKVGSGSNSFAGPRSSPTVDGNLIFTVNQWGELSCVSAESGKKLWHRDFEKDFGGSMPRWGFSESPLVDGNQVVVTPGGPKGAMVALNKQSGEVIWQSQDFTDEAHYASIVIAEVNGVRQYVQLTAEHVVGISPPDGKVLWKTARRGRTAVIPTPIVNANYVYVTSGYNIGSHLFKVISNNSIFNAEQVYANNDMTNQHGGVVKVGDYLYGYSDSKGLACQNFLTGEVVWSERQKINKCAVSFADGMLYCREERSGTLILVEAVHTGFSEKGRLQPPDRSDARAWPHPTVANGKLYLRDQNLLFCYDVRR
jgi:outer membrane protein assembly factor BamB